VFKSRWNWDLNSHLHVLFFTMLESCKPLLFQHSSELQTERKEVVEPALVLEMIKTHHDKPKLLTLCCYVLKRICFQQLGDGNQQEDVIGRLHGVRYLFYHF